MDVWNVVIASGTAAVACWLWHVARGIRQEQQESTRRDLMALPGVKISVEAFGRSLEGVQVRAFAPPRTPERESPIGWLWWRVDTDEEGELAYESGWALTYRSARRKAGAPLKSEAVEVVLRQKHGSSVPPGPDQYRSPSSDSKDEAARFPEASPTKP
ncbi:hypothetical protein [Streptomyces sp. NPDC058657]|uniref:hypothetical protein n=1 Tax=unclassified Streptomyces TaxID=2593676 RepID=UPI00365F5737